MLLAAAAIVLVAIHGLVLRLVAPHLGMGGALLAVVGALGLLVHLRMKRRR
jgi:hypothetical protein